MCKMSGKWESNFVYFGCGLCVCRANLQVVSGDKEQDKFLPDSNVYEAWVRFSFTEIKVDIDYNKGDFEPFLDHIDYSVIFVQDSWLFE